ncbi:MAG: type 1 glutamine amidotransferase [Alphaproteobacteria bacterium]|nr:type 1 glutamine amidotransferase [Alphaproteobacteria bacterium]
MPRILIFNGAPQAAETRLGEAGARPYETLIKESLDQHVAGGAPLDTFMLRVADGERLPQGIALADFDGVWISGSPLNAYRLDQPSVREQIELCRAIWTQGTPTFGSCWGMQVMTAALGGTVHLNPRGREIGVARRIQPNEEGRRHAMYRDKADAFDALCSHEDEIAALPAGSTVLASNAVSRIQSAVIVDGARRFWGVQYHPEFEFATVAAIIATRAERHLREGLARDQADVAGIVADYRALGDDPRRKDLAWRYGLGPDVLETRQRTLEFRNWLEAEVMPYAAQR